MQSDFDDNLQKYFTDVEHLRGAFKEYVAIPTLSKRLLVIHGVGGSGKSSLLHMFRIHCKSNKIPVALASGDDAKSVLDVIARWMEDLKADGVKFSSLSKTMETYRAIQAKVDDQAKKTQNGGSRIAAIASKAASKTAETAGGALLGAAIGSVVPGVGTAIGGALGGVVSGMGAEALTDWLRGFLTKPDIDLLLDPAKRLAADFLVDMAKAAEKKRIVLLLDTYEQMAALEEWVGEVAQKIHPNILMVVAGRKLPDWDRTWQGWMASAQVEELKPMTEDNMRQLICRYYATIRSGEPDPAQADIIISFARGLPIVVTSAVQLWAKYNVEDFQSVKTEIVANLVDRLMEGVPSKLIPALEAAAVVRWFDQPILRAVTGLEDVRDVYNELRRFPFVRTRAEGLALHDSVREIMDENLHVQDSERHSELHERAAMYFEKRLEKITGEETERLGLERLYHRVRADEESGIKLFQEMAEELTQYRLVNRIQALLNDAHTYRLERNNHKLWLAYYDARLNFIQRRFSEAELLYSEITESQYADDYLRAYALCSWGEIKKKTQYVIRPNGLNELLEITEKSNRMLPEFDKRRIQNLTNIGAACIRLWRYDEALNYLNQAFILSKQISDPHWIARTSLLLIDIFAIQGNWRDLLDAQRHATETLSKTHMRFSILSELHGHWCVSIAWAGRYAQSEQYAREWLQTLQKKGDIEYSGALRDLGLSLAMQGKYDKAFICFEQANKNTTHPYFGHDAASQAFWGEALRMQGNLAEAEIHFNIFLEFAIDDLWKKDISYVYWLGMLNEMRLDWNNSITAYNRCLDIKMAKRHYFECGALTGIVRIKHAQGDCDAIILSLTEAEQLAQQYEYNDHLASLRLTQGRLAWQNGNHDDTLVYHQEAMIFALRYNRFLLDELISGRSQGTPLHPVIPYCLERGEEGKKVLIALRDWWKTGSNDIGAPRPDTISPIPERIPLLEAEKIAREREPGDGSAQKNVIEQLEEVL